MLKNVPSLSVFLQTADGVQDEDPAIENEETLERTITVGHRISRDFSFVKPKDFLPIKEEHDEGGEGEEDKKREGYDKIRDMGFVEDGERGKGFNRDGDLGFGEEEMEIAARYVRRDANEKLGFEEEIKTPASPPMHLASGLGIDTFDLYGNEIQFDLPSFDDENCDGYYKMMLEDYPFYPLLLRNYAQFLEYKGDLHGAEDYYQRCTLVEPNDGEILASYARLVMKLHQDIAKASNYFERAVRASPEDSNVLAAYARFLWETNDEDDDEDDDDDEEENYRGGEQYEEKPNGAEDRSSSWTQTETEDGEKMYQYAKLFWEVHHDHEKASLYFKKAVQASPDESDILAAYARFLWETDEYDDGDDDDDDDDDDEEKDRSGQVQVPELSSS